MADSDEQKPAKPEAADKPKKAPKAKTGSGSRRSAGRRKLLLQLPKPLPRPEEAPAAVTATAEAPAKPAKKPAKAKKEEPAARRAAERESLARSERRREAEDHQGQGEQERPHRHRARPFHFQQHHRHHHRPEGERDRLVERRQSRLQRLAQKHRLRRADGRAGCLPPGNGPRPERSRSPRARARAPAANPLSAPSKPSASISPSSATSLPFRTTAAARRNSAASEFPTFNLTSSTFFSWADTPDRKQKSAAATECRSLAQPKRSSGRIILPACTGRKDRAASNLITRSPWARSRSSAINTAFSKSSSAAFSKPLCANAASPAKRSFSFWKRVSITSFSASASRIPAAALANWSPTATSR